MSITLRTSPEPRVSVLVLTQKDVGLLRGCLRSLAQHLPASIPAEVLLLCNGASPEVVAVAQREVTGARVYVSPVNLGFGGAGVLVERLHQRLEPAGLDLGVVVEQQQQLPPGLPGQPVVAAAEAEVDRRDEHAGAGDLALGDRDDLGRGPVAQHQDLGRDRGGQVLGQRAQAAAEQAGVLLREHEHGDAGLGAGAQGDRHGSTSLGDGGRPRSSDPPRDMYNTGGKSYDSGMATLSVSAARDDLPGAVQTAQSEAVVLERYGQPVAVLLSTQRYDELLAAAEEDDDVRAFDAALAEEGPNIPWEQVKADLGWT